MTAQARLIWTCPSCKRVRTTKVCSACRVARPETQPGPTAAKPAEKP
jgi:hypothetical protein